jgi:hypothetical protein
MEVASASRWFLDFWLSASPSCGLLFVVQIKKHHLTFDLWIWQGWLQRAFIFTGVLCCFASLSEEFCQRLLRPSIFAVNHVMFFCKKNAIEEMLHGVALLCNISSWCCGVVDCDYLSGCDVYSIGDVVLNFYLCVIAPLGSTFALLRLAFVQFCVCRMV